MTTRRVFLRRSALGGISIVVLGPGCGDDASAGESDAGALPDGGPRPDGAPDVDSGAGADWVVVPPVFMVGGTIAFDLTDTLPSSFAPGGTFGVAPDGTPLPSGMDLTPVGLLTVGTAVAGTTDGVVFTYTEP